MRKLPWQLYNKDTLSLLLQIMVAGMLHEANDLVNKFSITEEDLKQSVFT